MIHTVDAWYVRLPSGKVLRADNTKVIRRYLKAGKLPSGTRVRRSPDEEWLTLEWTQEFADLVKARAKAEKAPSSSSKLLRKSNQRPGGVASHLDSVRLPTINVGGIAGELLAALDNTFTRRKMLIAGVTCLASGLILTLFRAFNVGEVELTWSWLGAGLLLAALALAAAAWISRMTYIELSRLRPAGWSESRAGLVRLIPRQVLTGFAVGGSVLLAVALLRWFPGWLVERGTGESVAGIIGAASIALETGLWAMLALTLLLTPLLAVEESSLPAALSTWWRLIRRHGGRAFVYQALAIVTASLITLPFAVPVAAAWLGTPTSGPLAVPTQVALTLLFSLAAAPFFAYLTVANVFIYLNLRYDYSLRR